MGNYHKKTKAKAIPLEVRLTEKRSRIYRELIHAEKEMNISEAAALIQELLDSYFDLIRLKMASIKDESITR